MRVLVTGGCGFIGSHVVDLLTTKGHEVMVIDDLSTGRRENLRAGINFCIFRLEKFPVMLNNCFEQFKPQAVLHLAAQASISRSLEDPERDLETNTLATVMLLRECAAHQVRSFVFASTSAVYADTTKGKLSEGKSRTAPNSPYGLSKLAAEAYARMLLPNRAVILRMGNVYGPRQIPIGENQLMARMIRHLKYKEGFYIFGDGKQKRDFVYVEDAARAFLLGINGKPGTYNIAGGGAVSVNEAARLMGEEWGIPNYEWKHDAGRYDERRHVQMDIFEAERELGWTPEVSLGEGMKRTMDWWNERQDENGHRAV